MSLEINYTDAPEGAQENMTAAGEGNVLSDVSLISVGVQDAPWATLEPGVWRLDGTRKIMPDEPKAGFWSAERSVDDGFFEEPPEITLSFSVPYTATGLTFLFSPSTEQWCSQIHVTWYNGQTLLTEGDFYPDSAEWTLVEPVESFDKIEIKLISTNHPGQFAKIQKISVGQTIIFSADEIESARLSCESDHSLCTIPVDTMRLEIYDRKDRTLLPQENQRIEIIKDGSLKASHYISGSTRMATHKYEISAQSAIGLLNDEFLGGMYTEKPVTELLTEILGEWEYELDSQFSGMTVSGYLPVSTQRNALQQVAFAIGALVTTQGSQVIRLIPIPKNAVTGFGKADIFLGGSVKSAPRIARVEVLAHSYSADETEEVLMREEEVSGEDVLFTFAAPHHSYTITGGTITSSDVNWVKITADGPVTLSGKIYVHNTVSHIKRNPAATAKERGNYVSVTNATLINYNNVQKALERLYTAKQNRQTVSQDAIISIQKAGDIVSSLTPWGTIVCGYISSLDSILTKNGHIAAVYLQGVEVTLESVWPYSGEIYSGGMEVLY